MEYLTGFLSSNVQIEVFDIQSEIQVDDDDDKDMINLLRKLSKLDIGEIKLSNLKVPSNLNFPVPGIRSRIFDYENLPLLFYLPDLEHLIVKGKGLFKLPFSCERPIDILRCYLNENYGKSTASKSIFCLWVQQLGEEVKRKKVL